MHKLLIQYLTKLKYLNIILLSVVITACSDPQAEQNAMVHRAVSIEQSDECHLCGMLISRFPGPKGEGYNKSTQSMQKFCSTKDLFNYILQPDNQRQIKEVYVHDMSKTPWQKPEDEYFIDGREAWYVIGSSQKGSMGSTLASFSKQKDATYFADQFGGKVYRFDEITLDML
ncbi:nitrous oxide reductase accessory protein NosL [Vibrio rumoiensis]|uniref:Nitrous oxide reductase accessory protein NosL n=1 Tax=Vibrio rumoiensis TaxID=76258 RepID=A0ABW7J074_9VIBR